MGRAILETKLVVFAGALQEGILVLSDYRND
jgi:hypothetical protein